MAALASEPLNSLGEIKQIVLAEIDNEVSASLVELYINLEIQYLTTKREFSHFFKRTPVVLEAKNADGISVMQLPEDLKKIFSITSKDQNLGSENPPVTQEFRQGYHYEIFWNETRKAFDAHFDTVGNTVDLNMQVDYYSQGGRLTDDGDLTRIATFYSNVIVLGVLKRCYRKLGDLSEHEIVNTDYREAIQAMIDDDAREHDLPQQMSPSNREGREEYEQNYKGLKNSDRSFWQGYQ